MKSPLQVGYGELISEQERLLAFMLKTYPGRVSCGSLHSWPAQHRIACAKLLFRLLKKHQKDPQLNMEDVFNTLRPITGEVPMPPAPKTTITDPDFFTDFSSAAY